MEMLKKKLNNKTKKQKNKMIKKLKTDYVNCIFYIYIHMLQKSIFAMHVLRFVCNFSYYFSLLCLLFNATKAKT